MKGKGSEKLKTTKRERKSEKDHSAHGVRDTP